MVGLWHWSIRRFGCHLIDIPFRTLGLKYPKDAECSVGSVYTKMWNADYFPEGCPPSSLITLNFGSTEKNDTPMQLTWTDGGIRPPHPDLIPPNEDLAGKGGYNGVMMIGEKGIIVSDAYGNDPKLYRKGEPVVEGEKVKISEPEFGHQRQWVDACKAGFNSSEHKSLTSSFDYSGPLTETVLMGNLALRSYMIKDGKNFIGRKKLFWDGDNMRITNMDDDLCVLESV